MNQRSEIIKVPKNEILWVQYLIDGKPKYAITSDKLRSMYYLCEVVDGKLVKTKHKNKDPTELEKYMQTKRNFYAESVVKNNKEIIEFDAPFKFY